MKILRVFGLAIGLGPAQGPLAFRLDQEAGLAGLAFGQTAEQIAGFETQFRKQGKPRLSTQLYKRFKDTTQLGGLGRPDTYWFRQGKFIGVDIIACHKQTADKALRVLTARYGSPQVDTASGQAYWLGQHTFILLELPRTASGCTSVLLGSLALLNELVREAPVRALARQRLGWQPDSIGLPKQLRP